MQTDLLYTDGGDLNADRTVAAETVYEQVQLKPKSEGLSLVDALNRVVGLKKGYILTYETHLSR